MLFKFKDQRSYGVEFKISWQIIFSPDQKEADRKIGHPAVDLLSCIRQLT